MLFVLNSQKNVIDVNNRTYNGVILLFFTKYGYYRSISTHLWKLFFALIYLFIYLWLYFQLLTRSTSLFIRKYQLKGKCDGVYSLLFIIIVFKRWYLSTATEEPLESKGALVFFVSLLLLLIKLKSNRITGNAIHANSRLSTRMRPDGNLCENTWIPARHDSSK